MTPTAKTSACVLFRVGFESDMRAEDADRLRRSLNMTLYLDRKHPAVTPPLGITRLDSHSGLFLVRDGERGWALECRTWRLTTLFGARQLDHRVPNP